MKNLALYISKIMQLKPGIRANPDSSSHVFYFVINRPLKHFFSHKPHIRINFLNFNIGQRLFD